MRLTKNAAIFLQKLQQHLQTGMETVKCENVYHLPKIGHAKTQSHIMRIM